MKTRSLTSLLAALTGLLASSADARPSEARPSDPAKVVVQLTTGDLDTFEARVLDALPRLQKHYLGEGRRLDAVVVVHGKAYPFFLRDLAGTEYSGRADIIEAQSRLHKKIAAFVAAGVRVEVCGFGMKKHHLAKASLLSGIHVTKAAGIALIDWQNRGYAYLPVP